MGNSSTVFRVSEANGLTANGVVHDRRGASIVSFETVAPPSAFDGGTAAASAAAAITGISISSTASALWPSAVTNARPLNNSRNRTKIESNSKPATKVELTIGSIIG